MCGGGGGGVGGGGGSRSSVVAVVMLMINRLSNIMILCSYPAQKYYNDGYCISCSKISVYPEYQYIRYRSVTRYIRSLAPIFINMYVSFYDDWEAVMIITTPDFKGGVRGTVVARWTTGQ